MQFAHLTAVVPASRKEGCIELGPWALDGRRAGCVEERSQAAAPMQSTAFVPFERGPLHLADRDGDDGTPS